MFESIKSIRPHFFSLREIEDNVSLDIKLPLTWKHEEIVKPYRLIKTKVQDKNDKFTLLSLIASATKNGYDVVFACALEIINMNKEEEEKRKLFQSKVKELEALFQKESLDKLKDITFLEDEQESESSEGVVGEGIDTRRDGDIESQESDD